MTSNPINDADLGAIRQALAADPSLEETVISDETRWQGLIFSAHQLEVRQPDGTLGRRDTIHHHGGAGVCVLRRGGELGLAAGSPAQICLVRQWRVALGKITLEIPAGKLEEGEDPAVCAARELEEETGLVAERLEFVAKSYGSPGFSDEATRIFLAHGLSRGAAHPDTDEFVATGWYGVEEALTAVREGLIDDAKTIVAVYAAYVRLLHEGALA